MASQSSVNEAEINYLTSLYRTLHADPEIALKEANTAGRLEGLLREAGYAVTGRVGGGYGFVAVLKNGTGPVVYYRFDLDALAIREQTGLPYASTKHLVRSPGDTLWFSHACGHDLHQTVGIGIARVMARRKKEWKGTLVIIGQPAEEISQGAKAMLEDSLYVRFPKPDYLLALHDHADLPAGKVGVITGPAMARVTNLNIEIFGKSAHAGYSYQGIDANVLLARIILALQTIVSREVPAIEPAVITIGKVWGGTVRNQVAEKAGLELTIRTYSASLADDIRAKIERQCTGEAYAMGLPAELYPRIQEANAVTPEVRNDAALTARLTRVFEQALGAENVTEVSRVMPGEDFSRYAQTDPPIPSMLFWLGAVNPAQWQQAKQSGVSLPSLHSSRFAPDAPLAIQTGVRAGTAALMDLLKF